MKTKKGAKEKRVRVVPGAPAIFGGAALGLVGMMMLLAPLAAAAPLFFAHAPYGAAHAIQAANPVLRGAGVNVLVSVPASFQVATGLAREGVTATVLATNGIDSAAVYTTTLGLTGLTFKTGAAGAHTLVVGWSVSFLAQMQVKSAGFPGHAGASSLIGIRATTYLVEPTTGQTVAGTIASVPVWSHMIVSGQYQYSQLSQLYQFGPTPVTLAASHTYAIYTVLHIDVGAFASPLTIPGTTVTTTFDLTVAPTSLAFVGVL